MQKKDFDPTAVHPLYLAYEDTWKAYLDFAEFDLTDLRSGAYLQQFESELAAAWANRKDRATVYNLCPLLVSIRKNYLFATRPTRQIEASPYRRELADFYGNCDRNGTDWTDFLRDQVVPSAYIFGWAEVLFDVPSAPDSVRPQTQEQRRNLGLRPYAVLLTPLEITDWALDSRGHYHWVRIHESAIGSADPNDQEHEQVDTYLQWLSDRWERFDESGGLLGSDENPLGTVPIVPLYFQRSKRYPRLGVSLLKTAVANTQDILNTISLIQTDELYNVGMLRYPRRSPKDELPTRLGPNTVLAFDAEAKHAPDFIVGSVDHVRAKMQRIREAVGFILTEGKLLLGQSRQSVQIHSGIQALVERLELFNELSDMADALERFELRVAAMVAGWSKGQPVGPEELGIGITYHREYALESLSDAAETLSKAMRAVAGVSPAAVKALLIGFIQRALPQGSPYLNEAIAQVDQAEGAPSGD